MSFLARIATSITISVLLLCQPVLAFQSPLSDESVREAYFLGQRHDETFARFLDKYTKFLPLPKTGPHIASVTFFTPFALLVQQSSQHTSGYSAQQAAIDHRNQPEFVRIVVQILLTDSYGPFLARPTGSRSGSPVGIQLRSSDFWRDFKIQVSDGEKNLVLDSPTGNPIYRCDEGGCVLTGANVQFDFPADLFTSGSAIIDVDPPEGDSVSVEFDLDHLR
jgi:hypothetical protein